MGCMHSKNLIEGSEILNPNCFEVIFADSVDSTYYNGQLEINGEQSTIRCVTGCFLITSQFPLLF